MKPETVRHTSRLFLYCLVGAVVLSTPSALARAQEAAPASEAIQQLQWMLGRWSGEGTFSGRDGQRVVLQSEEIRGAMGGAVIVVEGTGRAKLPDGSAGDVVFRAFGVLSAGEGGNGLQFVAWQGGHVQQAHAEIVDATTLTWGFDTPGGTVRYTVRRPEPDVWQETGEILMGEGQPWRPFFEMTLHRVNEEE